MRESRTTSGLFRTYGPDLLPLLLTVLAALLWAASLGGLDLRAMNDLGLISVMPVGTIVAMVMLTAAFVLALRSDSPREGLLALQVGILIVMLYALPSIVEPQPRFPVTWRHAGITEYVVRNASVDPTIDAYFNWPGFFTLSAFAERLAGLPNILGPAHWAPVFFNFLYLGPLLILFRGLTTSVRAIWLAIWLFFLCDWIGQDYYSPQAINVFLYLLVLAIVLRWLWRPARSITQLDPEPTPTLMERFRRRTEQLMANPNTEARPAVRGLRAGLVGIVIILFVASVASHQLTPFAMLLPLVFLALANVTTVRGLPVVLAVVLLAWLVYLAIGFLSGHFAALAIEFGRLGSNIGTSVGERIQGSSDHRLVINARLVMTLAVWTLAALGFLRSFRHGRRYLIPAILAVVPLAYLAAQDYGGEILLRVYLFGVVFVAFLVATLFVPRRVSKMSWPAAALVFVVAVGLTGGFFITRYGNERMDWVSNEEAEGIRQLYSVAPKGSLLVGVTAHLPWKDQDYELYDYRPQGDVAAILDLPALRRTLAAAPRKGAYLITTRGSDAYAELFLGHLPAEIDAFDAALNRAPFLQLVFSNRDSRIYRFVPGA